MLQSMSFALILLIYLIPYGITQTYDELKTALKNRDEHGVLDKFPTYPRLHFEPNLNSSFLIHYVKPRQSTYEPYVTRLKSLLAEYDIDDIYSRNLLNCYGYNEYRPVDTWDTSCSFDLFDIYPDYCLEQYYYGYEDGQPCILLSLETILNWLPEPYTNETVPDKIRDDWSMYSVTVHCEGEDPVTKDNLGDILYYPRNGFRFAFFPFTGQKNWMSPLVFVQLDSPNPAMALRVTCSVYAKNVMHDDTLGYGKVSFDVMID